MRSINKFNESLIFFFRAQREIFYMLKTIENDADKPQVEQKSKETVSENADEIQRLIDLINSLDQTNIIIGIGGIKRIQNITSTDWIKTGLADALINVLLHFQTFDLLIIDSVLKLLLQLTISTITDYIIFCREDFIVCLLNIDMNIHFSSGIHCLTLLNNFLIDHNTNQHVIEILAENDFCSYLLTKLQTFTDVYNLEENQNYKFEFRERFEYIEAFLHSFVLFIRKQNPETFHLYAEHIQFIFRLLFDNTPLIEGMSLEIIALLSSNHDIYRISHENNIFQKLNILQANHEPEVVTSLYQCYLLVFLYETTSIINEEFLLFLANDITICNECSFEYIHPIINLIVDQNPQFITEQIIQSLISISTESMIKIVYFSISNLLHIMSVSDDSLIQNIFANIHKSILSALIYSTTDDQLIPLLRDLYNIITKSPSIAEQLSSDAEIIDFLDESTKLASESSSIAEQILLIISKIEE